MDISVEALSVMPSGRVIHRWLTPKGSHAKMRIVKPVRHNICDLCFKDIEGNAVKTESGGNITILTQCLKCASDEVKLLTGVK